MFIFAFKKKKTQKYLFTFAQLTLTSTIWKRYGTLLVGSERYKKNTKDKQISNISLFFYIYSIFLSKQDILIFLFFFAWLQKNTNK